MLGLGSDYKRNRVSINRSGPASERDGLKKSRDNRVY